VPGTWRGALGRQASGRICPLGLTGQSTLVDLDGSGRREGPGACWRACWRGASPGAVGARGLRRHMAGSRVLEIGLLRARPTQCPSQKLDVSTAEGHTMTLEPVALAVGSSPNSPQVLPGRLVNPPSVPIAIATGILHV
jgi:hypothetical protein